MRPAPRAFALTTLTLLVPAVAQDEPSSPPSEAVSRLVDGNTGFALDLYARLRGGEGNLAFSPHSLSTALAMTRAAARGRTAEEIGEVLRFPYEGDRLHTAYADLASRLEVQGQSNPPQVELSTANALWYRLKARP